MPPSPPLTLEPWEALQILRQRQTGRLFNLEPRFLALAGQLQAFKKCGKHAILVFLNDRLSVREVGNARDLESLIDTEVEKIYSKANLK